MHAALRSAITVALVAALVALTACSSGTPTSSKPPITSVPASTTVATSSAPVVSSGPITTPVRGTAVRTAIIDAVDAALGLTSKPTVLQLFMQDSAAVGEIEDSSGSRTFFAVTGGPDTWQLAWSATSGTSLASSEALLGAAPAVSAELAGGLDFSQKTTTSTTSSTTSKSKTTASPAPSLSSFKTYAQKSAKNMAGSTYTGTFKITAKIAKDSTGVWWGNAIADPSDGGLDPIGVWGRYANGSWSGQSADFSTEGADAGYFPADVLSKLKL